MRARRAKIRRDALRRQRRRLASAGLFIALAAAAVLVGRSPLFAVSEVRVTGVEGTLVDEVRAAVRVQEGQNLFDADLAAARARVEDLAWVQAADLDHVPPSAVEVNVQPRHVAAVVQTRTASWVVDPRGRLIAGGVREDAPSVIAPEVAIPPLGEPIEDSGVRAALAIIADLPDALSDRVVRYELDGAQVTAVLETADLLPAQGELQVVLGSARRTAEKAAIVPAMVEVISQRQRDQEDSAPVVLDVRAPENPVLRPVAGG